MSSVVEQTLEKPRQDADEEEGRSNIKWKRKQEERTRREKDGRERIRIEHRYACTKGTTSKQDSDARKAI